MTAQQRLAVWESRFDGLRRVADGQAPSRMLGSLTAQFTERLQVEAAREKAVADGIVWDDSESDSDSDSDEVGSLVLFPSNNGDGVRG